MISVKNKQTKESKTEKSHILLMISALPDDDSISYRNKKRWSDIDSNTNAYYLHFHLLGFYFLSFYFYQVYGIFLVLERYHVKSCKKVIFTLCLRCLATTCISSRLNRLD